MNQEKIGKLIAKMRKEKGLTQQELGDKVGVGYRAVSKWETGLTLPDISIINELSNILGITADELLKGELQKKPTEPKPAKRKLLFIIPIIIVLTIISILFIMKYNKEYKYDLVTTNKDCYVEGTAVFKGDKLTLHINKVSINNYDLNHTIIKNYQYKILSKNKIVFGFGYDSDIENLASPVLVKELLQDIIINYHDELNISKEDIVNNHLILEFTLTDEQDNIINKKIEIMLIPSKEFNQPSK